MPKPHITDVTEVLKNVVYLNCCKDNVINSNNVVTYAIAIRMLAELRAVEIMYDVGSTVVARWKSKPKEGNSNA